MGMAHNSPRLQGSDCLVGRYKTAETLRIHPPIAVRDRLQRNVIYARKTGRGTIQQPGQFPAVTLWQMPSGRADLLFDQIEVVEQPFPCRSNPAVCLDRLCKQVADIKQDALHSQPAVSGAAPGHGPGPIYVSLRGPCHAAPSDRR